jgi:hypothetical protein
MWLKELFRDREKSIIILGCVSLFVVGVIEALLAYDSPFWNYDFYLIADFIRGKTALEILTAGAMSGAYYRPTQMLIVSLIYGVFGADYHPYRLLNAPLVGMLGVVIYLFHLQVNPEKQKVAYLSSMFIVLSSPVWFFIRMEADAELIGVVFLYLALIPVLRVGKGHPISSGYVLLIAGASLMSVFSKETTRAMLPVMLLVLGYFALKEKKLNRRYLSVLLIPFAASVFAVVMQAITASAGGQFVHFQKQPLSWFSLFLTHHHLIQLSYIASFSGVLVFFVSSIKKHDGLLGFALLLFVLSSPVIISMSFYQMLILQMPLYLYPALPFSAILLAALIINSLKGDGTSRIYSAIILAVFFAVVFATTTVPLVRGDTSPRTYMTVLPLFSWLVIDSFFALRKKIPFNRTEKDNPAPPDGVGSIPSRIENSGRSTMFHYKKINAVFLTVVLIFGIVAVPYHLISSDYNLAQSMGAQAEVEFATKKNISMLNMGGDSRIYTLNLYSLTEACVKFHRGTENVPSVESVHPLYNLSEKKGVRSGDGMYFYLTKWKAILPNDTMKTVQQLFDLGGCFNREDVGSYIYICMPYFSTPVENYLEENGTLIFSYKRNYYQIPLWLEDSISRHLNSYPWITEYEWTGENYAF